MRAAALSLLTIGLVACSHVDTGEIDYRRAEKPQDISGKIVGYDTGCPPQQTRDFVTPRGASPVQPGELQCPPLLGGKLFRKNTAVGAAIAKNDVYSIRLEHGLIAAMTEPSFAPSRFLTGKRLDLAIGEIVILANVFEFGDGPGTARSFADLTDLSEVKVVYYSPDVERRQDLNFSNIPLKAPATYNGNPVGLQIIVLELDRMSSQMQSLLKTLAGLGQQSNLAPGGQAGALLLKVGTSMLTQNNDDTIFEYRFVLDPADGSISAQSAPFEAGRYVLKRTDDRTKDQIWRNLEVDHNTGRLFQMPADPPKSERSPYTDDTYFTINVIKHPVGTKPSDYGFKTLAELGKDIADAASIRDTPIGEFNDGLEDKLVALRANSHGEALVAAWEETSGRFRAFGRAYLKNSSLANGVVKDSDGKTCKMIDDYDHQLEVAELSARRAATKFINLYKQAAAEKTGDKFVFGAEEQQRVLDMIGPFFAGEGDSPISVDDLTDYTKFSAKFAAADAPALFQDAMLKAAQGHWASDDCGDLVAMGLATLSPANPTQTAGGTQTARAIE